MFGIISYFRGLFVFKLLPIADSIANDGLYSLFLDLEHCTDEYITRFLLARKYRTEQAAALIAAYQAQITHRQDIFGNLTARDPALQRALRAGIPGVLPARDRYEQ